MLSGKFTSNLPSIGGLTKQLDFGTARGMTKTAKQGQSAIQDAAKSKLSRKGTNWMAASSRIGIRIKPATPGDKVAEVRTAAYFGDIQDRGGVKLPFSRTHLAIPAKGGPLANSRRIPDNLKPKALVATGKAWIEKTEKGTLLLVTHGLTNKGKHRGTVLWYVLVQKARIKPAEWFHKPGQASIDKNLVVNVRESVADAIAKAR